MLTDYDRKAQLAQHYARLEAKEIADNLESIFGSDSDAKLAELESTLDYLDTIPAKVSTSVCLHKEAEKRGWL